VLGRGRAVGQPGTTPVAVSGLLTSTLAVSAQRETWPSDTDDKAQSNGKNRISPGTRQTAAGTTASNRCDVMLPQPLETPAGVSEERSGGEEGGRDSTTWARPTDYDGLLLSFRWGKNGRRDRADARWIF
jgi:hypothetical protein